MSSVNAPTPTCPRCCAAPLRFVASGDCSDSTGGGAYRCAACGYSTARDLLVGRLLRELRAAEELLERYVRLTLPDAVRMVAGETRCSECEARWRAALREALDRADAGCAAP